MRPPSGLNDMWSREEVSAAGGNTVKAMSELRGAARCLAALSTAVALAAGAAEGGSPGDDAFQAATNLFAAGRWAEAAEAYAGFAAKFQGDPRVAEAELRSAESLFRAARLEESLTAFESCAGDPRARFRVANVRYLLGRHEEAAAGFRELLGRRDLPNSLDGPARYFLARSLLALGRPDEAQAALESASKTHSPAAAYARLALGDLDAAAFFASRDQKLFDSALGAYRAALERAEKGRLVPEALFRIGELFRRAGRAKEAGESYRRAAEGYPSSPVAPYARLGLALTALAEGALDLAAREAARSRELAPEPELAAEAACAEGAALLSSGRYAEAARALESLLDRTGFPMRDKALQSLALAALGSGRYDLAAAAAERLAGLALPDARAAEARYLAGEAALGRSRPAEALEHFVAAAAAAEGETAALAEYRRAWALWELARAREAAMAFDEFAAKRPAHGLARFARASAGRAYLAAGDASAAADRFRGAAAAFRGEKEEPELLWGAAVAEYMRGNFDAMASLAREILQRHGSSARAADAAYWLAWSRLERKDLKEASDLFRDAAARATASSRPALGASALLEAASALERAGERKLALSVARELVTGALAHLAPVEAALWVAQALRESGDGPAARAVLDMALERSTDERPRLLYALAELARESGETERALGFYESVLSQVAQAEPSQKTSLGGAPDAGLLAAARLGKARCLAAKGRRVEAEVILENLAGSCAGWAKAAAHVELGKMHLEDAGRAEAERRAALAAKARDDFMMVALLFEPEGAGEGARLCASALVGAARSYALLGRYAPARDRLEQVLADPVLSSLPEAREARVLLQQIGIKAAEESRVGGAK